MRSAFFRTYARLLATIPRGSFSAARGGGPRHSACSFTGWAATNVREHQWHPSQKVVKDTAKDLVATFDLSNTTEFKRWLLGYGRHAVVITPKALANETQSEEEKAFLLSELALELFRAKPEGAPGCLPVLEVKAEIMAMVGEIRKMVPDGAFLHLDNLRGYVDAVFGSILA